MTLARVSVESLASAEPLRLPGLEQALQHEWLVWDAWTGGRRRVDLHPIVLSAEAHAHAIDVALRAFALVASAAERASVDPAERAHYALDPDVERLAAASRAASDLGILARVDLLLREDGQFVACEVNADCPGGFNETLALPRLARSAGLRTTSLARSLHDPTSVATRLADRLVELSGGVGSPRGLIALAYATAYAEDLQICALLERLVTERGGRAVRLAPTALRARPGDDGSAGLLHRGEPVRVLYRFYPLEYMAGQANLGAIEAATRSGALVSFAGFGFIHAQSKLAMARAFDHDQAAAREVFPETRAFSEVAERLGAEQADWVVKRDLSRVGDHVFVGRLIEPDDFAAILADVADVTRPGPAGEPGQAWIAQRFVPQATVPSPWGPRLLTLGVYVFEGRFAGYFGRLSETSHCTHDALVLPVFVAYPEDGAGRSAA